MSKFGEVAAKAALLVVGEHRSPPEAWADAAAIVFPKSESSRAKGCPRGAFLGLAAAGRIRDVPARDYGKASKGLNARYARAASDLLKNNPSLAEIGVKELWRKTLVHLGAGLAKAHNSQMDVVLRLFELRKLV